jgi:PAS domain-containing protein
VVNAIRVCADYRPKLGHGADKGYSLAEFQKMYRSDPFYNWVGLDNPLMYAAHKAAGGMTSIYRQIGIGCECLFRRLLQDALGLTEDEVRWSYTVRKGRGKTGTLYLDGRIPTESVKDATRRNAIGKWIAACADELDVTDRVAETLQGVVFEVRQGYKSKDSKRQNADIANAATAYTKGYLPCVAILSLQIDDDIALRYRNEKWALLTGSTAEEDPGKSLYAFMRIVVGYDLAAFFQRHSATLKAEVHAVLTKLLSSQ